MIEEARATGLYAELEVADMVEGLRARPDASANLLLAADAMCYVGDIAPMLAEAKRVLAPGGVFAFTLETHKGDGVVIGAGLRYAHAAEYVRAKVTASGLAVAHLEQASPRNEDNEPVQGLVGRRRQNLSLDATRGPKAAMRCNFLLPGARRCQHNAAHQGETTMKKHFTRREFGATAHRDHRRLDAARAVSFGG